MGGPGSRGLALQAGIAAGADTDLLDQAWWSPGMTHPDGRSAFALWFTGGIFVNQDGNRFVNESRAYDRAGREIIAQLQDGSVTLPYWMIYDDKEGEVPPVKAANITIVETEKYVAPEHLRPALRNQPQRYVGRGAAVKRLDHINLLAADVRPNRVFAEDVLGFRLYERIELDDGVESGAWLSLTIAAHELIYVADAYGARGRLHHLAFWVDTREEVLRAADLFLDSDDVEIEFAPSKHAIAQGFFLYGIEPGGNRIEVTTGGYFVYDPDPEPLVWSEAERARGQAWGVETVQSFHTYGTPVVER